MSIDSKVVTRILIFTSFFAVLPTLLTGQTKEDCLACHSDNGLTTERKGKSVSLFVDAQILGHSTHQKLVCVACHAGFDPNNVPHKEKITPVQCQTCHKNIEAKHPFHKTVVAKAGADANRMCKNCHGKHDVQSPKNPGTKFSSEKIVESCGNCHQAEKEKFLESAHGKAFLAKNTSAPTCIQCHSKNVTAIVTGSDSVDLKIRQEQVCVSCHVKKSVGSEISASSNFVLSYEQSVHGMALNGGNARAANCVSCHGGHEMRKGGDPASHVNRLNIPKTCSQCHPAIAQQYRESIHGTAFLSGNSEAPVCTNCHGEHRILAPKDPNSPVSKLHVSAQVCSPCHGSLQLNEKFGIASERVGTFNDSYHGLATTAGSVQVANCASCHGFHDILPSVNPKSRVNRANLALTCGKCHPGANENFTHGAVHVVAAPKQNDLLYFISTAYIILIVVTVGGMFLHNFLDFVKKAKRKLRERRGHYVEEQWGHALYLRMAPSERYQHASLLVSFILLVLTGFMLKFPDAWWVAPIRSLSPSVFEIRSLIHRIAAVVMLSASVFHIYYITMVPRGKELIRVLIPKIQDVRDAIAVAKYNLGMSRVKPLFGRFSYVEKAEYWALIWGTIVMAVTGFIMWFDNTFIGFFTKLGYDVARAIHYYEAWLATLSIIVWHFYFVIFNPDVYPMNLAWLKGTITEEEMMDEHPLELEQIKRRELLRAAQAADEGDRNAGKKSTRSLKR